jgi:plasmid stability protein
MMLDSGQEEIAMTTASKRSTVYFDEQLHTALRLKAAHTHRSVSELVNDAVRAALAEDQEDLAAFSDRVAEPTMSYEALLDDLKAHGKL